MAKKIIVLLFLGLNLSAGDLKCRVLALSGHKIIHSSWSRGMKGCSDLMDDIDFTQGIFGDTVKYGLEIRALGRTTIKWKKDEGKSTPKIYVIPPPRDEKDETMERLNPSNL